MKPRSDSKLKTLPSEVQEKIYVLLGKVSYQKAVGLIFKEHGVRTSVGALSGFYSWFPFTRRIEQSKSFADDLKKTLSSNPNLDLDAEKISQVAQVAFELKAVQEQDPALYIGLTKLRLAKKDQQLNERRIQILEQKAELADKAKKIVEDGNLSEEEQAQQMRSLFGMG